MVKSTSIFQGVPGSWVSGLIGRRVQPFPPRKPPVWAVPPSSDKSHLSEAGLKTPSPSSQQVPPNPEKDAEKSFEDAERSKDHSFVGSLGPLSRMFLLLSG